MCEGFYLILPSFPEAVIAIKSGVLTIYVTIEQKFTGGPFGITTKIPKSAWSVKSGQDSVRIHEADNGSGVTLHREFCSECGSGLLEYGVGSFP